MHLNLEPPFENPANRPELEETWLQWVAMAGNKFQDDWFKCLQVTNVRPFSW